MPRNRTIKLADGQIILVIPYIRVSEIKGRRDDRLLSPDLQLADEIRALDEEYGKGNWKFYCEPFIDLNKTGGGTQRAGFINAVKLARSDEFAAATRAAGKGCFVVYNISRWSRELGGQGNLLIELQEHYRVECLSAKQGLMDLGTREGRIKFGLHNLIDHDQLLGISEDWQDSIYWLATHGYYHGPTPPFGYTYFYPKLAEDAKQGDKPKPRELHVDKVQAACVLRAMKLVDTKPTLGPATRCLQDGGYRTSSVHRVLRNPVYIGKVRVWATKPTNRTDSHGRDRRERTGEYEDFPGNHEAIVPEDLFYRVQERLGEQSEARARTIHSLSGLIFCSECGRPLSKKVSRKTGDRAGTVYVGCKARLRGTEDCPGMGAAPLGQLEDAVFSKVYKAMVKLVESEGERAHERAAAAEPADDGETPDALEKQLAKIGRAIVGATKAKMLTENTREMATYDRVITELRADEESLAKRLTAAVKAHTRVTINPQEQLDMLVKWEAATPEERNLILHSLGVRAVVRRTSRWREPMSSRLTVTAPWFTVTRKAKDHLSEAV
jgi:hypothetical protein